ncbi:MAG: SBBP repeat-containing protein, partial [Verrucomicrobiota bacterium]|nr:SBBP repeat-containing protein [Verrucomicrobiota bacterium]
MQSWIRLMCLLVLSCATDVGCLPALAEPPTAWVARYSGSAMGRSEARSIAIDGAGNVYVTGVSLGGFPVSRDYATIKYDAVGNELWVARYDGPPNAPANGADEAVGVAVDDEGNVYVTGTSVGSGSAEDYATIKYDPDGNELWVTRYNGPGNGRDAANHLATDASGNLYVTGSSVGSGTGNDFATVKYDRDGNELWVARYNGPANLGDSAIALVVDAAGNVYVTGQASRFGGLIPFILDYATIKYDPDGNELWVAYYDSPLSRTDRPNAIGRDPAGNVYVTGSSYERPGGEGGINVIATVKYDGDGNELWVARYGGPFN